MSASIALMRGEATARASATPPRPGRQSALARPGPINTASARSMHIGRRLCFRLSLSAAAAQLPAIHHGPALKFTRDAHQPRLIAVGAAFIAGSTFVIGEILISRVTE